MEEREREKEGRKEVCQLNNSFVPNFIFTFVILCPLFWSFCSTVCMIYSRKWFKIVPGFFFLILMPQITNFIIGYPSCSVFWTINKEMNTDWFLQECSATEATNIGIQCAGIEWFYCIIWENCSLLSVPADSPDVQSGNILKAILDFFFFKPSALILDVNRFLVYGKGRLGQLTWKSSI